MHHSIGPRNHLSQLFGFLAFSCHLICIELRISIQLSLCNTGGLLPLLHCNVVAEIVGLCLVHSEWSSVGWCKRIVIDNALLGFVQIVPSYIHIQNLASWQMKKHQEMFFQSSTAMCKVFLPTVLLLTGCLFFTPFTLKCLCVSEYIPISHYNSFVVFILNLLLFTVAGLCL